MPTSLSRNLCFRVKAHKHGSVSPPPGLHSDYCNPVGKDIPVSPTPPTPLHSWGFTVSGTLFYVDSLDPNSTFGELFATDFLWIPKKERVFLILGIGKVFIKLLW